MRRYSMYHRSMASVVGLLILMLFGSLIQVPTAKAYNHEPLRTVTPEQASDAQAPRVTSSDLVLTPPPPPVTAGGIQLNGTWRGPYTFRNLNSGKCLEIGYEQTQDGARANQWTCMAPWTQQMWWTWRVQGDGYIEFELIANAHSRKCLDIWNFYKGSEVVQAPCITFENQIWSYTNESPNLRQNSATAYCMEVAGGGTGNGALILQWDCHGRPHQVWLQYNV